MLALVLYFGQNRAFLIVTFGEQRGDFAQFFSRLLQSLNLFAELGELGLLTA